MLSLDLKCEPVPNPYPERERDHGEIWARIDLAVVDEQGATVRSVLSCEWNADELLTWLVANKQALLGDPLPPPLGGRGGASIAERVQRFYNDDEVPSDEDLDQVFAYRVSHGVRFGMRGTDVPDVYVGLGGEGYEISAWDDSGGWRHPVDVADFVQRAERIAGGLRACR